MDQRHLDDLGRSGLVAEDLGARDAGAPEFAALKVSTSSKGYVIPYYDIKGERIPFYRVRLFDYVHDGKPMKYKQQAGTGNHVFFPKAFQAALKQMLNWEDPTHLRPFILLTEGEKKAAAACKLGIPCVALGGVDSWRNRTIILPSDTTLEKGSGKDPVIRAKLTAGSELRDDITLAKGLQQLVDLCAQKKLDLIIVYDTDMPEGVKFDVQRAAASLANQILHMGLSTSAIRQLTLPYEKPKVGLDDFIVSKGVGELNRLVRINQELRTAFPKHPNIRSMVNAKLQATKLDRREVQEISLSLLADLDTRGRRMRSSHDGRPFYFDEETYKLMDATLLSRGGEPQHESLFGNFLYRSYGIGAADGRLVQWLATQFTGEEPISIVDPKRIISLAGKDRNEIALQISDSHFVVVSGREDAALQVYTNGSYGILFEQGHVEATDARELIDAFNMQMKKPADPWWFNVFKEHVSLLGGDESAKLASLLYYISPFLLRWRGTQLPVELTFGEPGSGKSSLYEMRLGILTGKPKLRNIPENIKDWYASVLNAGGLHVIDNVQFTNKELRQRLSDEICRITTEPNPHIEMRKLYTTSGQYEAPVTTIFAMTAVQQPFYNNDIIQRGAVFEMEAVKGGNAANWVDDRIQEYGGRTAWIAHHLVMLHRFLKIADSTQWNNSYRAQHRLANYEQSLRIMAQAAGMDDDWIPSSLVTRMQRSMRDADWTLEAIKEYADYIRKNYPKGAETNATKIAEWAELHDEHATNPQLTNPRSLGRYLTTHRSIIEKITGMQGMGDESNTKKFFVGPRKSS